MQTTKLIAFAVECSEPLGTNYHVAGFDEIAYGKASNPTDTKRYVKKEPHLHADSFKELAEQYFKFRKVSVTPIQILYGIAIDDLYDSNKIDGDDLVSIMRTRPFTNIEKNKFTAEIFHILKKV